MVEHAVGAAAVFIGWRCEVVRLRQAGHRWRGRGQAAGRRRARRLAEATTGHANAPRRGARWAKGVKSRTRRHARRQRAGEWRLAATEKRVVGADERAAAARAAAIDASGHGRGEIGQQVVATDAGRGARLHLLR